MPQREPAIAGIQVRLVSRKCTELADGGGDLILLKNSNVLNPPDQGIDLRGRLMDRAWINELLQKKVFEAEGVDAKLKEREILEESDGEDAWSVAIRLSQHRFDVAKAEGKVRPNQKRPEDLPLGAVMRDMRPARMGLLLIYPLSGGELLDRLDPAQTIYSCVVSFPSSSRAEPVEYQVNDIYVRLRLAQLELADEDA